MTNRTPTSTLLRAGPLTLLFDNGMVRSVRYGDTEIVRRVYMALRDQFWNTIPFTHTAPVIEQTDRTFKLTFEARHATPGIDFTWQGAITGEVDGTITITMRGEAHTDFLRNRIGWCVLHPLPLCKNAACTIEHADGSIEHSRFPGKAIAPHQPFLDVKAITYDAAPGVACTIRFDGDVFETEDQRNWTDATFKTYSTPQAMPVPVRIAAGTRIEQTVTISLSDAATATTTRTNRVMALNFQQFFGTMHSLPRIGLRVAPRSVLARRTIERLNHLGINHLRFDIDPGMGDIREAITAAASICRDVGCNGEFALYLSPEYIRELDIVARELRECAPPVARMLVLRNDVLVTPAETIAAARRAFADIVPPITVAAGTNRYFVEVNRAAPLTGEFDALCFSATPQVHTFDDRVIMENLEGFGECMGFARAISGGKPVVVSPLTLRPRFDPSRPQKQGGADDRQRELFGAAWLTGAISVAAAKGLDALTCFNDIAGPEGIIDNDGEALFPIYHVLASGVCTAKATAACILNSDGPTIAALAWEGATARHLLVANLSDASTAIPVTGLAPDSSVAILDESSIAHARVDMQFWEKAARPAIVRHRGEYALTLQPYAVARLAAAR